MARLLIGVSVFLNWPAAVGHCTHLQEMAPVIYGKLPVVLRNPPYGQFSQRTLDSRKYRTHYGRLAELLKTALRERNFRKDGISQ